MRGRVKMWKIGEGYGFLIGEDDKDVFCHARDLLNLEPYLVSGDLVEFETTKTEKGLKAIQVRKIGST